MQSGRQGSSAWRIEWATINTGKKGMRKDCILQVDADQTYIISSFFLLVRKLSDLMKSN